jgi:hypothetical protein
MRILIGLCAAALAIMPLAAHADPRSDVSRAIQVFSALRFFHADLISSRGTTRVDYAAPNKFSEVLYNGRHAIIIGNDLWMDINGHRLSVPGAMASLRATLDNLRTLGLTGNWVRQYSIQDLGAQPIGHEYRLRNNTTHQAFNLWLRSDYMPVQTMVPSAVGTTTVKYSRYNVPVTITP